MRASADAFAEHAALRQLQVRACVANLEDSFTGQVLCAQWERRRDESCVGGPALVLCSGSRFRRLAVHSNKEECFEIDRGCEVAEFWFLLGQTPSIFMISQSGGLCWARWPGGNSTAAPTASNSLLSETTYSGSHHHFICAAVDHGGASLCAVSEKGCACLTNSDGAILNSRLVHPLSSPRAITCLQRSWAILCGAPDDVGVLNICDMRTLELRTTVELPALQLSRIIPWGQVPSDGNFLVQSDAFLAFAKSPLAVVSLSVQSDAQGSSFRTCPLPAASGHVSVVSGAAFLAEPSPLVACGLSDGTVYVLRGSKTLSTAADSLEICGKHVLSPSGVSLAVSCGFAAWSHPHDGCRLALFAATGSGEHRVWLSQISHSERSQQNCVRRGDVDQPKEKQIGNAIDGPTEKHIGHAIDEPKGKHIGNAIDEAKGKHMGNTISEPKGKHIGNAIDEVKGKHIGNAIDEPKGKHKGNAINEPRWKHIGNAIDEPKGRHIGNAFSPPLAQSPTTGCGDAGDCADCYSLESESVVDFPLQFEGATPLPPRGELEALILQTTQEIQDLEREAKCLDDKARHAERSPRSQRAIAPLPSLNVPSPPKIVRYSREQCLDAKWIKAQRERVDPMDITRSYLDRACRPQRKPRQPYWVTSEACESFGKREILESTESLLSCDPLEEHLQSLCQPW